MKIFKRMSASRERIRASHGLSRVVGWGSSAVLACLLWTPGGSVHASVSVAAPVLSIEGVGPVHRDGGGDGLSGITRLGGNRYAAIDDSGARLYPLTLEIHPETGVITAHAFDPPVVLIGTDLEGVAYNAARHSVYTCDEVGSVIREHALSGDFLGEVTVPPVMRAYRINLGLESLSLRDDGLELWTCNEEALFNVALGVDDGPRSTRTTGTHVRLTRFTREHVQADWTLAGQWVYVVDPMGGDVCQGYERSGVVEVCVLPDGTLLVLERELSQKPSFALPTFRARIYQVDFSSATEVSGIQGLSGACYAPVSKTRLWGANTLFANFEGMCLGPRLADGSVCLVLVSDADPPAVPMFYSLKLHGLDTVTGTKEAADVNAVD